MVAVWRSGSPLVLINEVNVRRAWLVLEWVTASEFDSGGVTSFRYVTSHPGRLSLLPSVDGKMSTSQRAVMLCTWGVKAVMAYLQVKLCLAITERLRKCIWYLKALYKCPCLLTLLYL